MKTHSAIGRTILAEHSLGPLVLNAVAYHHERCDGQGYPDGLIPEKLSIYPRIVAVADTFDALTCFRSYRMGMPTPSIATPARDCTNSMSRKAPSNPNL